MPNYILIGIMGPYKLIILAVFQTLTIFDEHLIFTYQIASLYKACYYHIR